MREGSNVHGSLTQCEQKPNMGTLSIQFKNGKDSDEKNQDNCHLLGVGGVLLTGRGDEGALWGAGNLSISIWVVVIQGYLRKKIQPEFCPPHTWECVQ